MLSRVDAVVRARVQGAMGLGPLARGAHLNVKHVFEYGQWLRSFEGSYVTVCAQWRV